MSEPDRVEVNAAFQRFWTAGNLDENWEAWPSFFTEDVHYIEHVYGEMRLGGRGLDGGRFEALEAARKSDARAVFARDGAA